MLWGLCINDQRLNVVAVSSMQRTSPSINSQNRSDSENKSSQSKNLVKNQGISEKQTYHRNVHYLASATAAV